MGAIDPGSNPGRPTNRSRLAPPSRVVSEEKGWWEGDDGPEVEDPYQEDEGVWVVTPGSLLRIFGVIIVVIITYTFDL